MSNSDLDKEKIWRRIKEHQDFPATQEAPSKRKWGVLFLFGSLFISMTLYYLSKDEAPNDTTSLKNSSSIIETLDAVNRPVSSTETTEITYSNPSEWNGNLTLAKTEEKININDQQEGRDIVYQPKRFENTNLHSPSGLQSPQAVERKIIAKNTVGTKLTNPTLEDDIENPHSEDETNIDSIHFNAETVQSRVSADLLKKANLLDATLIKPVVEDNFASKTPSLNALKPRNALILAELERKNFMAVYKADQAIMSLSYTENQTGRQSQKKPHSILFSAGIGTYKLTYVDSSPIANEKFFSGNATKSFHTSLGYQYQKASLFGRVSAGFSLFENELDYQSSEIKYLENIDTKRIEKLRYDNHYNFHHYLFQYSISTVLGNRFQLSTMSLSPYIGGSYQMAYRIRGNVLDTSSEVVNAHSASDFKPKNRFALNFGIDVGKNISANNELFMAFDCSLPHSYTNDGKGEYKLLSYRLSFGIKRRIFGGVN